MVRKKVHSRAMKAGLVLIVVGAVLALCSTPVFTFVRDEMREVPKSEIIMDYSFDIHQLQDKMVQVQLSIGQKLDILATGNGNFNFSIANFTDPTHVIQPDQPDLIYLSLDNTTSVNTTWSPTVRSAQPGSYYLIFLARNASPDFPVHIAANVTKTWTDIQTYVVSYRKSLIDSSFAYIGLGIAIFGAAIFLATLYRRHRPGKRVPAR
jgi:hypothetical protein